MAKEKQASAPTAKSTPNGCAINNLALHQDSIKHRLRSSQGSKLAVKWNQLLK
jgi:hypothetical protein